MAGTRQQKFSRLIQKEIGEILHVYGIQFLGRGVLISITDVSSSPDLSYVKVYISIFPTEKRNDVFGQLNENVKEIRKRLGDKIGKQVRHTPEIVFILDDTQDYVEKMEVLFKNIHIPKSDIDKYN